MNLVIPFTPTEEARLSIAAKQSGLEPAELIKRLTLEHLPLISTSPEDEVDAKLRQWQAQDGKALLPDIPASTLFAQWAEEDAKMTDEEREAEDRLWQDFEKGINQTRAALGMRAL